MLLEKTTTSPKQIRNCHFHYFKPKNSDIFSRLSFTHPFLLKIEMLYQITMSKFYLNLRAEKGNCCNGKSGKNKKKKIGQLPNGVYGRDSMTAGLGTFTGKRTYCPPE